MRISSGSGGLEAEGKHDAGDTADDGEAAQHPRQRGNGDHAVAQQNDAEDDVDDAEQADARQDSRNLLLSPHAEIDAKPQLEIYSDDVKCGHGATVGRLDEDALFYLASRGIDPDQIRPIVTAFSPTEAEIDTALAIIEAAAAADWAPVQHDGRLHDRASYRYFWQVIERAHQTGHPLPETVRGWFLA